MSVPNKKRKWLKWIGIVVGTIILLLAILYFIFNEAKPVGKTGPEAEALAQKMLQAIDHKAWDSTTYVQWTFKSVHHFLWDKKRHFVQVTWDQHQVLLNTKQVKGKAWTDGKELSGEAADQLVYKAWEYFCNDSFWLNAPAKAFDPGTERSIVSLEDGSQGLMVSYISGGVTPGDAYLWILDDQGLPKSWKMWVNIIPIGGLEFSWEDWTSLATGAKIAQFHKSSLLNLDISNLQAGMNWEKIGLSSDPFTALVN